MLCDNCKKNQAAVYIEQITNGETTEVNLCYKCSLDFHSPMFLNNILKGMFHNIGEKNVATIQCPSCQITLSEFRKTGKLGCNQCYPTFKKEISTILKNIQWGTSHRGKIPQKNSADLLVKKEVQRLRREQATAIEREEYEEAARLRDKIKEMELGGEEQ
ncbi:MAG: UvrB/UvrC motif-containing protein [Defluviitaleaceae bacterium]|nr:UvrB/UvrC motif-containing protein [Defluviitaleaceae bacterium]